MIDIEIDAHDKVRTIQTQLQVHLDGLDISFTDQGPDDYNAIIFIHGFPLNKSMWDYQVEQLQVNHRVIAYDVRGHGATSEGAGKYSIALFAEDLMRLMDHLEIKNAILCGHSMGGYIAMDAISRWPERFTGAVLTNTQCMDDTPQLKTKRMKAIQDIQQYGIERFADESILNLFAPASYTTRQNEIESIREMIVHTKRETLTKTLRALMCRDEACSKLNQIHVPVLLIAGKEDRITPPAATRMMNAKIYDAWITIMPHAGHLCNLEMPDEFNALLQELSTKTLSCLVD